MCGGSGAAPLGTTVGTEVLTLSQASETLMPGGEGPYSAQSGSQLLRLFFPRHTGFFLYHKATRSFLGLAANKDTHPGRPEIAHSFSVSAHGQL